MRIYGNLTNLKVMVLDRSYNIYLYILYIYIYMLYINNL